MTATYLLDEANGQVTALDGIPVSGENIVLVVGTSTGRIMQLTMTSLESPIEVFSTAVLKIPVRRLHIQDDDTLYVLGSHKVYLFSRSNCSEFTSCAETMAARNPLCGWCVNKNRATRKSQCSEAPPFYWISSLYKCYRMVKLTPSNIPVNVSKRTSVNVNLTFEYLTIPLADNIFKGKLVDDDDGVNVGETDARRNGMEFSCAMPLIKGHVELKLKLFMQTTLNESILLSEAPILFFECEKITGCADCINRSDQRCNWCNDAIRCQTRDSICKSDLIDSEEFCPHLADIRGKHFLHAGHLTSLRFQGQHLPMSDDANKYIYTCKTSSTFSYALIDNNSILCSVNAPKLSDKALLNETAKIYYGTNGTRTALEDYYKNYVTVYNCSMLASDCSHCKALNKTRFRCGWCSNTSRCAYRDDNCYATECPAPTITAIIPRDGPVTGNTRVTIYGFNLGSSISEIESIKVSEIPCNISEELSQMIINDYGNFESRVPKRIICWTASSNKETSGTVSIIVNGKVSNSDVIFSFWVPAVAGIVPNYGPIAGGTRITISGQNLGIGNRNVHVRLEEQLCLRPEVTPKLSLDNITPANFTITCTVDKGYMGNISKVTVSIDNDKVISEAPALFTFVANPIVNSISPKNAFLSGGTKITIKGVQINNAHVAKITLNHGQGTEIGDCIISSESLGICHVPRAPESLKEGLLKLDNTSVQCSNYMSVLCFIHLDNVKENVEIAYYNDPTINVLSGSKHNVKLEADDRLLRITGKCLDHVATINDVIVTVGVESCVLVELSSTYITCIAPKSKPESGIPNNVLPEVNVTIGNLQKTVGYVDYDSRSTDSISSPIVIQSAAVVVAVLILIISIATVLICRKYRRMRSKLRILVNQHSKRKEDIEVIRFSRLAGKSAEKEYSDLYNDSSEPYITDHYNTIPADDIESSRHSIANDSRRCQSVHLPETNTLSQDTLLSMNKITVEIQLEGKTAKSGALGSIESDDKSYLHPVSGKKPIN